MDKTAAWPYLQAVLPDNLHPTLVEMATAMFSYLVDDAEALEKLGPARLADIVIGQLDLVAIECGGAGFYLPKGLARHFSERDRKIVAAWNGRNKRELAKEHQLSEMRIDQIMTAWRRAEFERRQGKLPGLDAE